MKTLRVSLQATALLAVGALALVGLGFALWVSGSTTATNGCSTTVVMDTESGDDYINVADETCFAVDDWIVINSGGGNEECHQVETVDTEGTLFLYNDLAFLTMRKSR